MSKNKPPNMDNETWNEISAVYDLCQEHGSDPWVIHEQLVSLYENTQPPNDSNEKDPNGTELSRDDALLVLRDAGFDETKSVELLDASGGDLTKALEMGTDQNLMNRAAAGEFGPPNLAMEEVQTTQPPVAEPTVGGGDGTPHVPSFDGVDPSVVKKVVEVLDLTEDSQWTEAILLDRGQQQVRSMVSPVDKSIDTMQTLQYPPEDLFAEPPAIPPSQPRDSEMVEVEGASEARSWFGCSGLY